ncbi:hypothetical protein AAG570_010465 [Ranatra chinensis]|uniref:GH18 domain-containing protein n=1 Tax=Ranatra chinensis TaxID=642074 RepID=A0ABD0YMM6_9HEMI
MPQNINPYLCTHLLYAFAGLDIDKNNIKVFDNFQDLTNGGYKAFTDLKLLNSDLKTMLAVGGWNEGSERFSTIVADEDRRSAFVKNAIQFLRMYNFDGVDLVWQYPAFREGSSPGDKQNFGKLVEELRIEMTKESNDTGRPPLLLSVAMSALSDYIDKGYDVPILNLHVDFINLIAYDYHLSSGPFVYHHSPLYPVREEFDDPIASQLNADASIRNIISKGMAPEKINLGIPTYGRLYMLEDPNENEPGSSAVGGGVGNTTVEPGYITYYEAEYANMMGLGGIMYWTIDDDDFRGDCHGRGNPLIWAGREGLLTPVVRPRNPAPPVTDGGSSDAGNGGTADAGSSGPGDAGNGGTADAGGSGPGDAGNGGTADAGGSGPGDAGNGGTAGDGGSGPADTGNGGTLDAGGSTPGANGDGTSGDDDDDTQGDGGDIGVPGDLSGGMVPPDDGGIPDNIPPSSSEPTLPPRRPPVPPRGPTVPPRGRPVPPRGPSPPPRVDITSVLPTSGGGSSFPPNLLGRAAELLNNTNSLLSFAFPGSIFFQDIKVWVINHFHNYNGNIPEDLGAEES